MVQPRQCQLILIIWRMLPQLSIILRELHLLKVKSIQMLLLKIPTNKISVWVWVSSQKHNNKEITKMTHQLKISSPQSTKYTQPQTTLRSNNSHTLATTDHICSTAQSTTPSSEEWSKE